MKKELTNVGVHTAFQYQLKSSLPYFNVQKNIKDAKFFSNLNINENGYTINLLPTNAFLQPIYLNIRFPHQRTYIVHEMITLLVISTLIILILIGSYVFFLRTIFQQKKLSDIKNDFVNNMTHELKTPIATLNLGIQYFNDKNIERTQQVEERTLKIMSNEIKRLNQLVESILTTATLEKAEIKTKFTKEHIHLLLNDIIQNVRLVMDAKGGTITMDLHAKNDLLEIDKTHFTNVINNLIDNAIKYCDKTPEINLTTYCNEKGIYISVKDNGPGIPKEHQKRVFEKFYRIPSGNTHNVKGFGLGLFYVKKIIDIHAGKIEIKSHIGKGSEFIIFLPFSRNAPDNHQNNC